MEDLVAYLAKAVVSHPDEVQVRETTSEEGTVVELRVHPSDMGVVIGRKGRTINAFRTLLAAAAQQQQRQDVRLEVVD